MKIVRGVLAALVVTSVSACSSGGSLPSVFGGPNGPTSAAQMRLGGSSQKITHVIVLVQENRTFDNLFHGYAGSDYSNTGKTHDGKTVKLRPGKLEEYYDFGHTHANFDTEYDNGKNDGFDEVQTSPQSFKLAPYQYVVRR